MKGSFIMDQIQSTDVHTVQIEENTIISNDTEVVVTKNRHFTNRYFLILQAISFVFLVLLINYCMKYGALERLTNGYDSCRNICGEQNVMQDEKKKSWCDGLDMTYRRYLLVFKPDGRNHYNATRLNQRHNDVVVPITLRDNVQRVCLVNCSVYQHYYQYKDRCILHKSNTVADIFWGKSGLPNFLLEVAEDVVSYWQKLMLLAGVSLVLSIITIILIRFLIGLAIWMVLIGLILTCLFGTIYTWVMWKYWKQIIDQPKYLAAELELRRCETYLVFAITWTLLTICTIMVTFTMKSRVEFIVRLFKETGKAVAAVPLLVFLPILTVIFVGTIAATWSYLFLWIESSGHDVELYDDFYEYQKDNWIRFARWYNVFIALWSIEFLIDCQHIIVAGAVSVWYFANDKNVLGSPIFYALYNLLRYHIGSVSCGSLAILMVQMVNGCFNVLQKYCKNHDGAFVSFFQKSFSCCFFIFEHFLKNLTRNAYIEIALYGDPFYTGGKNANKTLRSNCLHAGDVDSAGHFVLVLGKVLISFVTMLVATVLFQEKEDIQHAWVLIAFSGYFAYLVCHCFIAIYEVAMDTIFLCFCEDCEHNDGIWKPYFMTHDLLKFVINFKKSDNADDNAVYLQNYMHYIHQN